MTGKPVQIDPATYRLAVTGSVNTPLSLALDVLRCMPKITSTPVLICKGYFEDVAEWSGVPLSAVLDQAGLQQGARRVTLVGADGYEAELSLETALRDDSYLAYEWSGEPLPVLHGYPLRAVIASELGNKWVKWLVEVRVE
jgi:DMSO/TMAO reductase YedYZ molybdopterin-dependent catalytic subunit